MAIAVTTAEKYLAYDGDCPMCTSLVGLLLRTKLVTTEQARSNHDLQGDDLDDVRAAGIRNQLVVLDPATRQTRVGAEGLLWIIGDNLGRPWWIRVLGLPGMRQLVSFAYEAVSYNRRIISPPRHQIVCDCEPEVTLGRRLMLIVPASLLALTLFGLLGLAVHQGEGRVDALQSAVTTMAIVGCGWSVLAVTAVVLLRGEKRIDYMGHLGVTLLAGALVMLPATAIVAWLPTSAAVVGGGVALLIAYVLMLRMQPRRHKALGLSGAWLWAWREVMAATFLATANAQGLFAIL